jgi:hypothetical protein
VEAAEKLAVDTKRTAGRPGLAKAARPGAPGVGVDDDGMAGSGAVVPRSRKRRNLVHSAK